MFDRKTNPQIAEELFFSQKTLEMDMRNIFRREGHLRSEDPAPYAVRMSARDHSVRARAVGVEDPE